jgi:hypothetical protein
VLRIRHGGQDGLRATGGDKSGWRRCSPAAGLGCDSAAAEVVVDDGGREKLPGARAKSQRWFAGIGARAVRHGRCGAELLRRRNNGEAAARVTRRCVMDEGQGGLAVV